MTKIPLMIRTYACDDNPAIRRVLEHIGWAEQYIAAFESNAEAFSADPEVYGVYVAVVEGVVVGFLFVQVHAWNRLAQIQGLAVDPSYQRQGIASALVERAEGFAKERGARGIYVDTPTSNTRGRRFYETVGYTEAYIMPRYYEEAMDGVTYQKFFAPQT